MDRRISRSSVVGAEASERLQVLHMAGLRAPAADLTPGMRALTALFTFVGTLENGGFVACMQGVAGDWTAAAIEGARRIGADQHAEVIERFVRVALLGDPAMDGDAREQRAESMTEDEHAALERLDGAFYALPGLTAALDAYVDRHPDEFFFDWDEPSPWSMCPELNDPAAVDAFVREVDHALPPDRSSPDDDRRHMIRVIVATTLSNADEPITRDDLFAFAVRYLADKLR